MPEGDDGAERQTLANCARCEREVIVLDENNRRVAVRFVADCLRKTHVDCLIGVEVFRAEDRLHVRLVTQRPETLVCETLVIGPLFLTVEPDVPQTVGPLSEGLNLDPVPFVDDGSVGGARAVSHPHARARLDQRFQRGDESAGGAAGDDVSLLGEVVPERLTVCQDDDRSFAAHRGEPRSQAISGPVPRFIRRVSSHAP